MLPPNDHVDHLWTGWKLPSPASLGRHKKKRQKNRYYIIKKKILHLIRIEHERVSRYFSRHFPSISLHRFGSMTEYDASSFFFFLLFFSFYYWRFRLDGRVWRRSETNGFWCVLIHSTPTSFPCRLAIHHWRIAWWPLVTVAFARPTL